VPKVVKVILIYHSHKPINEDNLNNIQDVKSTRHFRKIYRNYLKDKTNELPINSKNKSNEALYRGINEFKRSYQTRSNLMKDENGDLLADFHNILNRRKNYFCQLLNVHNISDVRQREIHTAAVTGS
jgi:hypothetical protein